MMKSIEHVFLSTEDIFLSLAVLDNWRRKHNKKSAGLGLDEYKPNKKFYYPEN